MADRMTPHAQPLELVIVLYHISPVQFDLLQQAKGAKVCSMKFLVQEQQRLWNQVQRNDDKRSKCLTFHPDTPHVTLVSYNTGFGMLFCPVGTLPQYLSLTIW